MDRAIKDKTVRRRIGRKSRIRNKISGTADCPRVTVFFSNKNVYAQMIDDSTGKTLASASTKDKGAEATGKNREAAKWVGGAISEKARGANITRAVFDRNGYKYHGRVKDLADAIREKGIAL